MFGINNLCYGIPNGVPCEAVFGKKKYFKYMIAVGTIWCSADGVMLHGDDAKESSSEPEPGKGNSQVWETESDSTTRPPMCKPLPSGKIMNVPGSGESVFTGDTRCQVEFLLDQSDDFDEEVSYRGKSLVVASELADTQAVQRLLDLQDTNVNMKDENENTALYTACYSGFNEIVKQILNHKHVDVNQKVKDGSTPLHTASMGNHVEIVVQLLDREDADINGRDGKDRTAFRIAVLQRNAKIVRLFLQHPRVDDQNLADAFTGFCTMGYEEMLLDFFELPALNVNKARVDGCTPLIQACVWGNLEIVEKLLERNEIEVNKTRTVVGSTPLYVACQEGHLEIVEKLLERSEIDVNKATKIRGITPLCIACEKAHLEIVEKLLEKNEIEVNKARTDYGETPLYEACDKGHPEVVEKLLERDEIEVGKATFHGLTPLSQADQKGHTAIANLLRNHINKI